MNGNNNKKNDEEARLGLIMHEIVSNKHVKGSEL